MSNKLRKQLKNKSFLTQNILITACILLIFTTIISAIFIKLADIAYEIKQLQGQINEFSESKIEDEQKEENKINQDENKKENTFNKPELDESYVPIKFIWTEKNEGYWVKTNEEDKEWYSIEEGIYPTFAYNPEIIQMEFNINDENKKYDVLYNWDNKLYIWISKSENIEDKYSELFLKSEKGTLLLFDDTWENEFNETYNRKQKIEILPVQIKEKIIKTYKRYINSSENENIEINIEEEEYEKLSI